MENIQGLKFNVFTCVLLRNVLLYEIIVYHIKVNEKVRYKKIDRNGLEEICIKS